MATRRSRRRVTADPFAQPAETAVVANLRYVSDGQGGIVRRRSGKGFTYRASDGSTVRDRAVLNRIRSLVIPPAWTSVWICADADGHLQATGRDVRGRKQYRYHPRWRRVRDETKFGRMVVFGHALPRVREKAAADLALAGLPRDKVLATIIGLLETTLIRVGNEEYARANQSFGLTTLKDRHVHEVGAHLYFRFKGKSGKAHDVKVTDKRLARLVRRIRELPGQDLFQYVGDDGDPQAVSSGDVNAWLREASGQEFTAKDFRTWAGTLIAARGLATAPGSGEQAEIKSAVVAAVATVAKCLGNTPAIARKSYIHPCVLSAFGDTESLALWISGMEGPATPGLSAEESVLLRYLESCSAAGLLSAA